MDDALDRRFWLEDLQGRRFYPVRVRDRDTGKQCFRVSPAGNTKLDSAELESLEEVARRVVRERQRVRVRSRPGVPATLMGIEGRNQLSWGCDPGFTF